MSEDERAVEVRAERLPPWAAAGAALWRGRDPLLLAGLVAAGMVLAHGVSAAACTFGLFVVVVGLARLTLRAPRKAVTLRASERGLAIDDHTLPRSELRRAFVTPTPEGYELELARAFPRTAEHLRFADRSDALRVMGALGLGLDRERQSFRVASWFVGAKVTLASLASFAVLLPTALIAAPTGSLAGVYAILGFVVGSSLLRSWSGRLIVGTDAVGEEWLWFERSYPISSITRAEPLLAEVGQPHRLRLHLRDAAPVDVLISSAEEGQKLLAQMTEWVEIAMSIRARPAPPTFRVWNEAHAGDGPRAQLAALRSVTSEYRGAAFPFSSGELFEVLDDPRAAPADRVAAAIALHARGSEGDRIRALAVEKTTALPALSLALRALREGDDAALERELGAHPRVRVGIDEDALEDADDAVRAARGRASGP